MKKEKDLTLPTNEQLENELKRHKYQSRFRRTIRSTIYTLIIVSAISILVATLLLPVLQIYGTSMTPTLSEGNIVVSVSTSELNRGDIVAFYYNNKILVKRVIATPGEKIDFTEDGTVLINSVVFEEPYIADKALGECNIELPYQVPDKKFFVMGDHRSSSIDSRHTSIGCIGEEQIVGKIVFTVWPLSEFGPVETNASN